MPATITDLEIETGDEVTINLDSRTDALDDGERTVPICETTDDRAYIPDGNGGKFAYIREAEFGTDGQIATLIHTTGETLGGITSLEVA